MKASLISYLSYTTTEGQQQKSDALLSAEEPSWSKMYIKNYIKVNYIKDVIKNYILVILKSTFWRTFHVIATLNNILIFGIDWTVTA